MNNWFKANGIHLAIIGFFIITCFIYFSPVLQGKSPAQSDVIQAKATATEIMAYKAKDGKAPLWTNQMFGGMPAYQIWAQHPYNGATYVISLLKTVFPDPVDVVLLYLLGAYLLFCVLRVNPWLAAAGAIAFAFTSYNFIIIAAGHSNKALAIAFCAPIIAGILLTLRGKYWIGGSLTALFLALEIRANHIQMTYYLMIALLIFIGIEIYHAVKAKKLNELRRAFGFLAVATLLAFMVNAGKLWTTYEYGKESNRGPSNLTTDAAEEKDGLSKEYAYGWSQGVGESFTFLIPNLYGGSSDTRLDEKSNVFKTVQGLGATPDQALGLAQQMPVYWGEKAITSGPYYFGAIICFLFVFGLFIVNSRLKWWILSVTILFMLLSFGKHFTLVSDIFFNYFPFYNKFRAVESILAIVGLMVPLLAILALKEAIDGKLDQKLLIKKLTWSAGLTGGMALIVALMPTVFFSFTNSSNPQLLDGLTDVFQNNRGVAQSVIDSLIKDRAAFARADALRSLLFIVIGYALIWAYLSKKMSMQFMVGLLGLTILVDMWQVDRRYLNNSNFVTKSDLTNFEMRDVDTFMSADKDPNFRVLDLSIATFSDASSSRLYKTIGGYHAAKLKRYQELIDKQFSKSINQDVLDMLNTKYIINRDPQSGSYRMTSNTTAAGNAWIVPTVQFVRNADEEMKAINSFDPKKEAIVDEMYKGMIDAKRIIAADPNASIKLDSYHPDKLEYSYSAPTDIIAVFSEIYYDKGWNMYVDGVEKPYFRANYVLRAAQLEAGNHKVVFKFEPTSYYLGEKISLAGSILLLGGLVFAFYRERKNKTLA